MKIDLNTLVRKNIRELKAYSSARSEYRGAADIFLDANENAFGSPIEHNYNRYPDPLQIELKKALAAKQKVSPSQISIGNGSDEIIDHIIRIFCVPGQDNIITLPPTFRMYGVAAAINEVVNQEVYLTADFQADIAAIEKVITPLTKAIFLCSPNNPTGNLLRRKDVEQLLDMFNGILVIDEAYIDFTTEKSFLDLLSEHNNLIILQTLSKAWGLAGLRIGIAYADAAIINILNKVKMPYNVSDVAQELAQRALLHGNVVDQWIQQIRDQRSILSDLLKKFSFVNKVFDSDANFLLVRVDDAAALYQFLLSEKIVVRNQSSQPLLENCLRITIGTPEENKLLINALKKYAV